MSFRFFVWRRGMKKPVPALQVFDPRKMLNWQLDAPYVLAIVALDGDDQELTLDAAIAKYHCPEVPR